MKTIATGQRKREILRSGSTYHSFSQFLSKKSNIEKKVNTLLICWDWFIGKPKGDRVAPDKHKEVLQFTHKNKGAWPKELAVRLEKQRTNKKKQDSLMMSEIQRGKRTRHKQWLKFSSL